MTRRLVILATVAAAAVAGHQLGQRAGYVRGSIDTTVTMTTAFLRPPRRP